jgi:DNA-binding winged helix-turn-helix (wHTH) protein
MTDAIVEFCDFTFVPATGELKKNGVRVSLEHQPAVALALLIASRGRLVTRQELASAVWRDGTHVKFDDGLNYCIRQLRTALEDDARAPRFIETVPRRGYRFVADVVTPVPTRTSRWIFVAAAVVATAVVAWVERQPNNHHQAAVSLARALHDAVY